MNKTCTFCDKPLKAIGIARKNGKNHNDWEGRELHKKCYKQQQTKEELEAMYQRTMQISQKYN